MTFAYREMQHAENHDFFQLESARHAHTHQTLNEVLIFAMGKQCQKI